MGKYSPGEIISANCPLVHVINDEKKSIFCDYCCLTSKNLKKCSACKHMHYCDSLCQKKDWKKHKFECPIYKDYYGQLRHNLDRFLLRLYLFLSRNKGLASKKETLQHDETVGRSFEDLISHQDDIEKDTLRTRHFESLVQRYSDCNIDFDRSTLFEYFCKICINSFSILNADLNEIGSALYIAESVFDHSCTPNAAPVFNGMYLEIRSIKEINEEEPISINYVDLKDNRESRQKRLREQFYFVCQCTRCRCTRDFDTEFDSEALKEINKQMDDCIDQKAEWMKALQLGEKSIPLFEQVYGQYHPDLTVQLVRMTKLRLCICGDLDNSGIQLVGKTAKHLAVTHGQTHELYQVFRSALNFD